MDYDSFISQLQGSAKTSEQTGNLEGIAEISSGFHKSCGISPYKLPEASDNLIVLESGHQPNYLPHAGMWRKIYLMHDIAEKLNKLGKNAVAVFGFADYNLSTASLLIQNRIPDTKKEGYTKIGFNMGPKEKWKRFNEVKKPGKDEFKEQMAVVQSVYDSNQRKARTDIKQNLGELTSLLKESYEKAGSFADYNAFFIAKVASELLGLKVLFFRYSDVQREGIFLEACRRLVQKTKEYNQACNSSIETRGLQELGHVEEHFFPLWYHCGCGGKVTLSMFDGILQGRCPVCDNGHQLDLGKEYSDLESFYSDMAPTAIARNLIFSEGLGTTLFVSGAGGGVKYGMIANDASDALGFNKPTTLYWKCMDYYLGVSHLASLNGLLTAIDAPAASLIKESPDSLVERRKAELKLELEAPGDLGKREKQRISGRLTNVGTQSKIASKVFSVTPSGFDVLANNGSEAILKSWEAALSGCVVTDSEFRKIEEDAVYVAAGTDYGKADIPRMYANMKDIR